MSPAPFRFSSLDGRRLACRDPCRRSSKLRDRSGSIVSELFENDLLTCSACRTEGKGW